MKNASSMIDMKRTYARQKNLILDEALLKLPGMSATE